MAGHLGTRDDDESTREPTRTRRVPVAWEEKASGVPEVAPKKIVAIELAVVAIELNVVAHPPNVVALGLTAVTDAPATLLRGLMPSRTRPMPSDPVRGCRDWVRCRCKRVCGGRDRVAWRRDSIFGARIPSRDIAPARQVLAHASPGLQSHPPPPRSISRWRDRNPSRRDRILCSCVRLPRSHVQAWGRPVRTPGTLASTSRAPARLVADTSDLSP